MCHKVIIKDPAYTFWTTRYKWRISLQYAALILTAKDLSKGNGQVCEYSFNIWSTRQFSPCTLKKNKNLTNFIMKQRYSFITFVRFYSCLSFLGTALLRICPNVATDGERNPGPPHVTPTHPMINVHCPVSTQVQLCHTQARAHRAQPTVLTASFCRAI